MPSAAGTDKAPAELAVATHLPVASTVIDSESPTGLSLGVSGALFAAAPVVVLASEDEALRAASSAAALGVPALLEGPGTGDELARLGVVTALVIGDVSDPGVPVVVPADDGALADEVGAAGVDEVQAGEETTAIAELSDTPALLVPAGQALTTPDPGRFATAIDHLPGLSAGTPLTEAAVLTTGDPRDVAALGTAVAAGAKVIPVQNGNPVAASHGIEALRDVAVAIGLGSQFGDDETLQWRIRAAATGVELPGGGQLVLPGKTYVALYGHPGSSVLGVLGEQGPAATVRRAEEHAARYAELLDQPVVPALEIIATVASAAAGADGDYSAESRPEKLTELVDLAGEHGMYVVLDLQPGRTDFLTQAKLYEDLLKRPWVGLALDPEWRLLPNQVHLRQIGHVKAAEVNEVIDWLAALVRENDLPQKLLILHQFQVQMIRDIDHVDLDRPQLAVMVHVDGQGAQGAKQATWRTLLANAPGIEFWGWKNFYDEDIPGPLTPAETLKVKPRPDFISYQ